MRIGIVAVCAAGVIGAASSAWAAPECSADALFLYHGASDPSIPASQSIAFYRELTALQHGLPRTQANVRLFLIPGMHHCSGGPVPDQFDTLSALENWAEHGRAPDAIQASTKPDSPAPHHWPLCPYPLQARFRGTGDVAEAINWRCRPGPAK